MERSWLVQRLKKPYKTEHILGKTNPFAFGGGLRHGGLSDEAMGLLSNVFSFDYMGAAEFEFGAVPKALQRIAKDAKKFEAFSFTIPLNAMEKDWRDKSEEVLTGAGVIYVICRSTDTEEVQYRIEDWAVHRYNSNLKEPTRLACVLRPNSEWDMGTLGWIELDNGFFFFTDEEMWKNVAELFGVET